ncbi:PREDICTED: serine/threonine-protein kinase Nek11-like [Branchiostoma belcheri]|uniref:non-specific serine/threonine protein kinase n=1 Tax=Branchiostoma belcheri TaxID=7741 RepID=A0A6P4YZF4_BRABE|nr:PREDICTED: serine/threonine-protein kinase Nek11-like [Branchiostoma belcheri]
MPLPKEMPRSLQKSPKKPKDQEEIRVVDNRYVVEKKLGSGNFGTAYLVRDMKTKTADGEWKVLKEISVGDLAPDETVGAMHEAKLLSKLDHPGIVKFHDSFLEKENFCIVTEFCEGGDLDNVFSEYRKQKTTPAPEQVMEWFIQLLLAVQHMHQRKVLHRDLKARNIFMKNNVLKVGDFGISRILMGTSDMATTFTGTPYYMSPEVLKHEGYNSKSDIWSIGCILYELCCMKHAFEGQSLMGVMYKIVEGKTPSLPDTYPKELNEILARILTKDPAKRPSAADLLTTPYIAKKIEVLKIKMADMKITVSVNKVDAQAEAQDIKKALSEKHKLGDMRREQEAHLTPRERMRIRKQQKAEEEARRLKVAAFVQYNENQRRQSETRHSHFRSSIDVTKAGPPPQSQTAWGSVLHQQNLYNIPDLGVLHEHTREQPLQNESLYLTAEETPRPITSFEPSYRDFDEQPIPTLAKKGVEAKQPYQRSYSDDGPRLRSSSTGQLEEKSAAEKNKKSKLRSRSDSGDDKLRSSSDSGTSSSGATDSPRRDMFEIADDDIPEDPQMAETFYTLHEDFESSGSSVEEDLSYGSDGELEGEDDFGALANYMQSALDLTAADNTTVSDDTVSDAFGPAVRDTKIRNMRTQCEKALGKDTFKKVYRYLKDTRFGGNNETIDEVDLMNGLRKYVTNPSDCFIVDQLLFLEEQAKIGQA